MWWWFFKQFIINYFCTRAVRRVIFNLSAKIFAYQWRAAWNFDVFGCLWGAISVFKLHSRTLKYFWVQLVNDKISMINNMFMFIIRVYHQLFKYNNKLLFILSILIILCWNGNTDLTIVRTHFIEIRNLSITYITYYIKAEAVLLLKIFIQSLRIIQ